MGRRTLGVQRTPAGRRDLGVPTRPSSVAVKTAAGSYSQADINRAVFSAARHLYKEMAGDMNPRLKRAMLDQEPAYYNLVAAQRNLTPRLDAANAAARAAARGASRRVRSAAAALRPRHAASTGGFDSFSTRDTACGRTSGCQLRE